MENQKSINKNMIMSIILTMSNFIFPLITYGYVSRVITPVGVGKVAFVNSILQYFSYIAVLGIPLYGLRECAKVRNNKSELSKTVQELFVISLISTIISYVFLFLAICSIPKLFEYKNLFIVMSIYIILNTIGMEWLYQALEQYSYITRRSIIFKLIGIILTFLLIHSYDDFVWYGFISIFTISASYICNFIRVKKYINIHKEQKYNFKKHLKPILLLFMSSIIITIYANFDLSMIGFISTEKEVGLYNAALKIKAVVLSLSTAITNVFIPRISFYISEKKYNDVRQLTLLSIRMSLILAFPLAIYILMYPENILLLLSGEQYLDAISTLRVLMLCVIPMILTNLFGNQLLIPLEKEKRYSQSVFIGMIINLLLNFILIPKYGAYGAAIGTLITEFWNALWMGLGVKEYFMHIIKNLHIFKYIIGIIIASVGSYIIYINITTLNNIIQLLITAFTFFVLYYIILIILREPVICEKLNIIKKKFKII